MAAGFKTATVNASLVPATQTDFPSYVDLSRLGITTLAEAQSVRVYADSGKTTEWARDIVSATEMHVKVPSLTSTVAIYVDWDGSSADYAVTDTYGRNAVWSDYAAVYHLEADSSDSTGNGFTGTDTNVTYNAQKFGNGIDMGTTSRIITSSPWLTDLTNFTIQSWIRPDTLTGTTSRSFFQTGTNTNFNWLRTRGAVVYSTENNVADSNHVITMVTTGLQLVHYVKTGDGSSNMNAYVNATAGTATSISTSQAPSGFSIINARYESAAYSFYHDAKYDEIRIRGDALSANWITTEYNNQGNESSFWGTWTTVTAGAPFIPRITWLT